jgi:hypothetical protein
VNPSWAGSTFRLHRDVVIASALGIAGLCLIAVWSTAQLTDLWTGLGCASHLDSCEGLLEARQIGGLILASLGVVPIAGVLLGVPIVARELERSTTPLAWSLDPSRWRWFLQRVVPLLGLTLAAGAAAALVADRLEGALVPWADPSASFNDYGFRGPVLIGRLVLAFGLGVLAGSLVGRVLPALVVTLALGGLLLFAIDAAHHSVLEAEAVAVPESALGDAYAGLQLGFHYELPSGERVSYEELQGRYPDPAQFDAQLQRASPMVEVIPPERYGDVVGREGAVDGAIGLMLVIVSGLVVMNRSPGPGAVRLAVRIPALGAFGSGIRGHRRRPGAIRLLLWPHRFEFAGAVMFAVVVSVAAAVVVLRLATFEPPGFCLADPSDIRAEPPCQDAEAYLVDASEWGNRLFAATAVIPWLTGALVGVVLVGREIDERTAIFAWSLSPDRRRWLLPRIAAAAGLVVVLLTVPAHLMNDLQRLGHPWVAQDATFDNYGLRGIPVVARGIAGLSIGILAGVGTGRVLAGILFSAPLCLAAWGAVVTLMPFGVSVDVASHQGFAGLPLSAGELVGVQLRETALLGVLAVAVLGASSLLLDRRTPDR